MYSGEQQIVSFRVIAGSLLGLPAALGQRPYSLTASVEGHAEVYRISCDDFKAILQQDPQFCMEALRILAAEVHSARTALGEQLGQPQSTKK